MRVTSLIAAVLFAAVLLTHADEGTLPDDPFSPSSGVHPSSTSKGSISGLFTYLAQHGHKLPKESQDKLSVLQSLSPDVLKRTVNNMVQVLNMKRGGEEGQTTDSDHQQPLSEDLLGRLQPLADSLTKVAPLLQELLERVKSESSGKDGNGVDLQVMEDKLAANNRSICQHLTDVCYVVTPF